MSKDFNYQAATVDAVAQRFQNITNQAYCHVLTYYVKKNDDAMVSKLQKARALSKIWKLVHEYNDTYGTAYTLPGAVEGV